MFLFLLTLHAALRAGKSRRSRRSHLPAKAAPNYPSLFPILLILSRELLITGLRLVAAGKGKTLAAESLGKLKTFIQLSCICLILAKIATKVDFASYQNELWHSRLVDFLESAGSFTLVCATFLTVYSGIVYLVKYWRFFVDERE